MCRSAKQLIRGTRRQNRDRVIPNRPSKVFVTPGKTPLPSDGFAQGFLLKPSAVKAIYFNSCLPCSPLIGMS